MSLLSVAWTWQLRLTTSCCDLKHQAMKHMSGALLPGRSPFPEKHRYSHILSVSLAHFPRQGCDSSAPTVGGGYWRAHPWCSLSFCHLMFDTLYQAVAGLSPHYTPCHGFCLWGLSNACSEWGDQLWEGQDASGLTLSASFTLSWNPKSLLPGTGSLLWYCPHGLHFLGRQ